MSEKLEVSADRFIKMCGSLMDGISALCAELKDKNEAYVKGKEELDGALAKLMETRANYVKESSVSMDKDISLGLDELTSRIQKLLGGASASAVEEATIEPATSADAE